ncbi:DUF397 domain-containing protein [Streptomyces sp. NPDC026665]|uniref:DUF397 domain-containing protein n=1 Tax=Streptomyces sp. NPDC026665 TaxID=3154798 RepID=UPI0033D6A8CD
METNTRESDLTTATWHKSSYSGGEGGNCLEVADSRRNVIPVRDSKNPGPVITFGTAAWGAFVAHLG